ncbi:MAG: aminotransferase class III-fold pyridoxal phosphate-dependent enzyme [Marinicaulis sp.]|nr:aminotransferase class III-fold pyridoxal phosphate-dependent enzyme [Marinicaulis sp.]
MNDTTNNHDKIEYFLRRASEIAADFSGFDVSDLPADKTFLEIGFDSLFLTQLATAYQKEFGVKLTFRQLVSEHSTLGAVAKYLEGQASVPEEPIAAKVKPEPTPELQRRAQGSEQSAAGDIGGNGSMASDDAMVRIFSDQVALMRRQLEMLGSTDRSVGDQLNAVEGLLQAEKQARQSKPSETVAAAEPPEKPVSTPAGFGPQIKDNGGASKLSSEQQAHIDRLIARYNARTAQSKRLTQANRAHHADPRTAAGFNPLWKELVYPIVVKKSLGSKLWDVDNNQYIDLLNGFGPNFFGHRAEFITDALRAQLDSGYEIGPQTPRAGDAAKLLCEITGMDRVSWVNTGSEAVQAAIRIARTVTGRNKIVVFNGDYHGNFDEVLVRGVSTSRGARTMPMAPGIPFDSVSNVIVCEYGEESALEIIRENAGSIAAVLVEPVQSRRPDFRPHEFLKSLRSLTKDEGIAFVFDEVITGFRIRPGGAQEYFDIKADLAIYGKIIGGGMPIGVVAGRSEFMDTFDGGMWRYGDDSIPSAGVTFFAGTFVRHPMAIAAAYASLQYIQNAGPGLQDRINALAERLANELNEFFEERGVAIFVAQFASQMFFRVNEASELATLFFYHLRDRGIHILEHFPSYMTAAHTDDDVDLIISAAKDSIYEMQADGILSAPKESVETGWRRKIPLTNGQREIWFASQMGAKASCAFNESDSIIIDGPINESLFREAVDETIAENEAFSVSISDDGAFQIFGENMPPTTQFVDVSLYDDAVKDEKLSALFNKLALEEFDLARGPIVRTTLVKLGEDRHVFIIYCHHIAFDGYSANLVLEEIAGRYKSKVNNAASYESKLSPFSVYATKQSGEENGIHHWRKIFGDEPPPVLELPTDRPRSVVRGFAGSTTHRAQSPELHAKLVAAAKSLGVSRASLFLAAYAVLLSRLSGQEDLVVGVPAAGQAYAKVDTVGYCVNMLPLRLRPAFETNFGDFANSVQGATIEAFEHQNVTIGEICNEMGLPRDPSRLPLVETVFNYRNYFANLEILGCRASARENRRYSVFHDLFFNVQDSGNRFVIDLDYSTDLFDSDTIDRWIDHYIALLWDIAESSGKQIGDLSLVRAKDHESAQLPKNLV